MPPLLSVIVPTRNRARLAVACVKHILSIKETNFELIVRDCSDTQQLAQQLTDISDCRLVYQYSEPVSMTENWNKAVEMARGNYVCIIGDDDGVNTSIVKIAEWASREGAAAVAYPYLSVFYWPDFPTAKVAGNLLICKCTGKVRLVSGVQELTRYMSTTRYVPLPRVYHGMVERDRLEFIRKKTGSYFHTMALDDYASYVLAASIGNYYFIDYPVSIAGHSASSNTGRYAKSKKSTSHIKEYGAPDRLLDDLCPPVGSPESYRIDALVKAMRHCNTEEFIDLMVEGKRYPSWYAASIGKNLGKAHELIQHLWCKSLRGMGAGKKIKVLTRVGGQFLVRGSNKLYSDTINRLGGNELMVTEGNQQYQVQDIGEAADKLNRVLKGWGVSHPG